MSKLVLLANLSFIIKSSAYFATVALPKKKKKYMSAEPEELIVACEE